MQPQYEQLKQRFQHIIDLDLINSLLNWDQSTYMPPGGSEARGRQSALVGVLRHQKLTDETTGDLIDQLLPWAAEQPAGSPEAAFVREAKRTFDQAVRIPPDLIERAYAHFSHAYQVWTTARPENDFKAVQPELEETLAISRAMAECFPEREHIADPLIDLQDPGMKAREIQRIFAELRAELVPLVEAICDQPAVDDSFLHRSYPIDRQRAFGEQIITAYGYDFNRGRQDLTHHPFMTKFSLGDVRITTRFDEHNFGDGLFSTLHESGHAMYEQGINPAFEASPLGIGTSSGVHESQSRLWENVVGHSLPFWKHYYPQAQALFPDQLGDVALLDFYKAINKVARSLIRVDADEVTYNLHVMIRFDLELDLLEGKLAVKDLAEAWHARYQQDLGLRAPDDRNGVLQDVHWYAGPIGGVFQGYTLGNILCGLFYSQAVAAHPKIPTEISQGRFEMLRDWMQKNIYQYGAQYTTAELVQRTTGGELTIQPYVTYLKQKYGQIYQL